MGRLVRSDVAKQLIGTVLRVHRAFGRVRFTVAWQWGEMDTITVPKQQFDAAIRKGDTVGTIVADPAYTAEDLLRWNMSDPSMGPVPISSRDMTEDVPPSARYYHRVSGAAGW
jgi:hypothetical protein